MATLTLKRHKAWIDQLRHYKIILNGVEKGSIKQEESWSSFCEIGSYSLQLKVDWCSSSIIDFDITSDNQIVSFECKNNVTSIFNLFKPSKWIFLIRKM